MHFFHWTRSTQSVLVISSAACPNSSTPCLAKSSKLCTAAATASAATAPTTSPQPSQYGGEGQSVTKAAAMASRAAPPARHSL